MITDNFPTIGETTSNRTSTTTTESTINDAPQPPLLNIPHSFIAGIRRVEEPQGTIEDSILASVMSSLNLLQCITWDRLRVATTSDENMTQLINIIEEGMPEFRHKLPEPIREYHQFRQHLHTIDGIVIYKDRIVIPPSLRKDCLSALHGAHQGVSSMNARAEASIFWPGITRAITSLRNSCNHCNRMAPSQPSAPPTPPVLPVYPFQCICSDFFHYKGVYYLVIVDRYSNWPIVERSSGGAAGLIDSLRRTFVTYGIAEEIASDGGPEFTTGLTRVFLKKPPP